MPGMAVLEVAREHRGQAQRGGDVEPLLVARRAADGHLRTLGLEHLRGEDAHGAGADDEGGVTGAGHGRVAQALGHAAQGLVERTGMLADGLVDLVQVALRHQHVAGEATVDVAADGLAGGAQVAPAREAGRAPIAGVEIGLGADALAHPRLRARAGLDHAPGDLVAHDHRWGAGELVVLDVEVGAADTGGVDLQQHLIRARHGPGHRSEADVLGPPVALDQAGHGLGFGRGLAHRSIVGLGQREWGPQAL